MAIGEGEKGWEETTVGGLGASYNNQIFLCVLKGKKEEGADNVGDVAGETTIKSHVLKRGGGGGGYVQTIMAMTITMAVSM